MENKYYTPSIEEFFVGFECETRVASFEENWEKTVVYAEFKDGWNSNMEDLLIAYNDGYLEFRVKYLDASDIEELGFIFEEQVVGKITFKYTKNNFIELHKLYTTILILNNGRTIFEGFIKNKSELIRLLGWLNV